MKTNIVLALCLACLCQAAYGQGTLPLVAIHDSEFTRVLDSASSPAVAPTPLGAGTTGNQWWPTNWHYFVMPDSMKEMLRSDGTAFTVIGDSNVIAGVLTNANGTPKYPIVFSLASEAMLDSEIAPWTNYVAAGGFLFVGSSSFTRNTNGTTRGDFALANAMGIHMVNPALTNWASDNFFSKVANHSLVANIPNGQLTWQFPQSSEEVSWPYPVHLMQSPPDYVPYNQAHSIWQVQPADATVIASGEAYPYLLVKHYGKGYFIYYAAMQPLIGHGSWAPAMYAYGIFKNAIQWAFTTTRTPVSKLSAWPYAYDAAVLFRHDLEAIPADINSCEVSAQYEHNNGAAGDYFFCTGGLRLDYGTTQRNNEIASLQRAVTNYGATIGSHNGGLTNLNLSLDNIEAIFPTDPNWYTSLNPFYFDEPPFTTPADYDYWHWGPDELLNAAKVPAGYASATQYVTLSISNSFVDLQGWKLTNSAGLKVWASPYFNATRDGSCKILEQLGVKITGDEKLGPFPSWVVSSQTPDKKYPYITLPVSDWYIGTNIGQSMEDGHTTSTVDALVDFYYNLGGLINLYSHSSSDGSTPQPGGAGPVATEYLNYSLNSTLHPRVWSANAVGIYSWWLQRSNVVITPSFTNVGSQSITTITVTGSANTNTTVEVLAPISFTGLQVYTNGVLTATNRYRVNGQSVKIQVGTSVTNAQVRYTLQTTSQDDFYYDLGGGVLTVPPSAGVLTNDSLGAGSSLTALLVSVPGHGTLNLNTNGGFVYTPTNNFTGVDSFTYQATDGYTTSAVATVTVMVAPAGDFAFDNFVRPTDPGSLVPWVVYDGTWTVTRRPIGGSEHDLELWQRLHLQQQLDELFSPGAGANLLHQRLGRRRRRAIVGSGGRFALWRMGLSGRFRRAAGERHARHQADQV